jgi:hypothetical protein
MLPPARSPVGSSKHSQACCPMACLLCALCPATPLSEHPVKHRCLSDSQCITLKHLCFRPGPKDQPTPSATWRYLTKITRIPGRKQLQRRTVDDVLVVEVGHRAGELQRGRDDGARVWRAGRLACAVPPEVALQQEVCASHACKKDVVGCMQTRHASGCS